MASDVINDPAFPTLTQTLAVLEKTGHDPVRSLRQAAERHELQSAESVAKVLNHRLELITANVDDRWIQTRRHDDRTPRRRTRSASVIPGS